MLIILLMFKLEHVIDLIVPVFVVISLSLLLFLPASIMWLYVKIDLTIKRTDIFRAILLIGWFCMNILFVFVCKLDADLLILFNCAGLLLLLFILIRKNKE